ncbi:hypothetical protein [Legionella sp. WA2022007384]
MKLKQTFLAVIYSLLMVGCSADMLVSPTSKYGPTDGDKTGRIRYLAEGASTVIEARRNDAFKKMYNACNGHYKILGDTSKDKLIGASDYNDDKGSSFVGSMEYVYIRFECTKK